jgi:hypothetical protein
MVQPPQACSQTDRIEVHEKTGGALSQFEVRDHLGEMDCVEAIDRLQLDDHLLFNQ